MGGGHVSLALSQVLLLLDFEIIVLDQRQDIQTLKDNNYASKKIMTPFSNISACICARPQAYVFIMAYGHLTDQQGASRTV